MKKALVLILLLSMVMLFSNCAARINNVMNSWMYHHYSEIITSWGPPQYVFDDGRGGRILIYTRVRTFVVPGSATTTFDARMYDNWIWGTAVTTYTPSMLYGWRAYRMFWINSKGYIYHWAWKGL